MKKRLLPIVALSALLLVGGLSSLTSCEGDAGDVIKTGTVQIETDSTKGTVTASKTSGVVGDKITLTISPKAGFKIDSVKVNNVALTGPTYSFSLVEGENKVVVTFKAEVSDPVVTKALAVGTLPTKVEYKKGEALDLTGLVVNEIVTTDGVAATPVAITDYVTDPLDKAVLNTVGKVKVNVTKAGSTATSFEVNVTEVSDPVVTKVLTVGTLPNKVEYEKGEVLDLTGLVVNEIVTTDGVAATPVAITDYVTDPLDKAVLNTAGKVKVNVTKAGSTATSFEVNVTDDTPVVEFAASIVLPEGFVATENGAAQILTADVAGLPSGKTIDDCTFTWSTTEGQFDEINLPDKIVNKKYFNNPNIYVGEDVTLTCKVTCGDDYSSTAIKKITPTIDLTKYTKISTVKEFIAIGTRTVAASEKFVLTNNIDLGGYVFNGRLNSIVMSGVIDGNGFGISNFIIKNDSATEPKKATGIWFLFNGGMRNISINGTIDSDGFSGLLGKEANGGFIVNSYFEAKTVTVAQPDWTWGRNGVIVSAVSGNFHLSNCVTKSVAENAQTMGFAAYTWAGQNVVFDNVYTNVASDAVNVFNPEGSGQVVASVNGLVSGVDFGTAKASDFKLDVSVWTLADGVTPKLAHDGETPVTLSPEISIEATKKSILIGEAAVITPTVSYTTEVGEFTFTTDINGIAAVVINDDHTLTVTGVSVGKVIITMTVRIGGIDYDSLPIEISVYDAAEGPSYEKPANAVEISTPEQFMSNFNGSAEGNTKNFYLLNDIDLSNVYTSGDLRMAGEYNGIFEGAGHKISGIKSTAGASCLFNLGGATSELRNVVIEGSTTRGGGYGFLANNWSGKMINVDVTLDINIDGGTNSFGVYSWVGAGTYEDCDAVINLNTLAADSNTFVLFSNSGPIVNNCTYVFNNKSAHSGENLFNFNGATAK